MIDEAGDALCEYEAKRQRRMEENQRMLQCLNLPAMSRPSPRPQATTPAKATVKLEPTRRSSRQEQRRVMAEQEERERQIHLEREIKARVLVEKREQREKEKKQRQRALKRKQQQELREQRLVKRRQNMTQQEIKREEQEKARKQLLKEQERNLIWLLKERERNEIRLLKERERNEIRLLKEQERQRRQHLREHQLRTQAQQHWKPQELPPEKIAERNADIQRLIQEELDNQARLANEQKQREQERRAVVAQLQETRLKLVHHSDVTTAEDEGKPAAGGMPSVKDAQASEFVPPVKSD